MMFRGTFLYYSLFTILFSLFIINVGHTKNNRTTCCRLVDIYALYVYTCIKKDRTEGMFFMLTRSEIEKCIKSLLARYHAEYALLFGSYARGEETPDSDIDIVVFGGKYFKKSNIFAFAEDLREILGIKADVFEISEVNEGTPFYDNIMREGVKIA